MLRYLRVSANSFSTRDLALVIVVAGSILAGCNSSKPAASQSEQAPAPAAAQQASAAKHYPLDGRVVSIDKDGNRMTVDHKDIPGFMPAMTMPYRVKDPQILDKVKPEDHITGDVVVDDSGAYIDDVTVVPKAGQDGSPKAPSGASSTSQH